MNTFLKVVLCVLAALIAIKLMPFLLVPIFVGAAAMLAAGALLLGGVAAVAGMGVTVLLGLLTVALAVLAVFSPIWIPVLAIIGVIALVRRASGAKV